MRFFLLLMAAGLLLSACAGPIGKGTSTLPLLSDRFNEAMRWQDYRGAAIFLEPQLRAQFLNQFQEDKDLHVVDSQVQNVSFDPDQSQAQVTYLLEYYRLPSTRIDRWIWQQQWRRQPGKLTEKTTWLIHNEPPPLPWQH